MAYYGGNVIRTSASFRNAASTLADPTEVWFAYKTPHRTSASFQYGVGADVIKTATGIYYLDISASIAGLWTVRAWSACTQQSSVETTFEVIGIGAP